MVNYTREEGRLLCQFVGRMDTKESVDLFPNVLAAVEGMKEVVFDLQEVGYVASGFLRICLAVRKRMGEANFSVVHVQPDVLRVLEVARLSELVKVSESR